MASYALLIAMSGFRYDMTRRMLGFDPIVRFPAAGEFRCFWSIEGGWGTFRRTSDETVISLFHGALILRSLILPYAEKAVTGISSGGRQVEFTRSGPEFVFGRPVALETGDTLVVRHEGTGL